MDVLYDALKFLHVLSFVFMSIPFFNLIVVNERGAFGPTFRYYADRYMENLISHGAPRCFVFQGSVLVTGLLLLILGPLGLEALWTDWVILLKTLLLFLLVGSLSYVHFKLQPRIETILANVQPDTPPPENIMAELKPHRLRRKRMAAFCLFIVITIILLGLQVYTTFSTGLTTGLILLAALFSWRSYKFRNQYGWV